MTAMIRTRGRETVRVTKVKGHAEDVDVQQGRVRLEDQELMLLLTWVVVISPKFSLMLDMGFSRLEVIGTLFCLICIVSMIAVAWVIVNHDGKGGTAPDPIVWDQGDRPKARKLATRVNVDLASLRGPPGFLNGPWIQVHGGHTSGCDIAAWPCSVGILFRFTSDPF